MNQTLNNRFRSAKQVENRYGIHRQTNPQQRPERQTLRPQRDQQTTATIALVPELQCKAVNSSLRRRGDHRPKRIRTQLQRRQVGYQAATRPGAHQLH